MHLWGELTYLLLILFYFMQQIVCILFLFELSTINISVRVHMIMIIFCLFVLFDEKNEVLFEKDELFRLLKKRQFFLEVLCLLDHVYWLSWGKITNDFSSATHNQLNNKPKCTKTNHYTKIIHSCLDLEISQFIAAGS
jgi:hypothetical protein